MSETVQGAWIQAVATIIAATFGMIGLFAAFYIGRFYERRDHHKRKFIETTQEVTPIIIPEGANLLTVAIDKEFLTNKPEDKGQTEPVKSAYNFTIGVINSGTEAIEHPEIDITIEPESQIVQTAVASGSIPREKIKTKAIKPNKIRVTPEYINSETTLKISILSINNEQGICDVEVIGLGVKHKHKNKEDTAIITTQSRRQTIRETTILETIKWVAITVIVVSLILSGRLEEFIINLAKGM